MAPPFSVRDYNTLYESYLYAKHFFAIRDAGFFEKLPERNGIELFTDAGGCRKRWNNWVGPGCLTAEVSHANFDTPYVRSEEGGVYSKKLGELIYILDEDNRTELLHRHFDVSSGRSKIFGSYSDTIIGVVIFILSMVSAKMCLRRRFSVFRIRRFFRFQWLTDRRITLSFHRGGVRSMIHPYSLYRRQESSSIIVTIS